MNLLQEKSKEKIISEYVAFKNSSIFDINISISFILKEPIVKIQILLN
jgi:hypothetical protein